MEAGRARPPAGVGHARGCPVGRRLAIDAFGPTGLRRRGDAGRTAATLRGGTLEAAGSAVAVQPAVEGPVAGIARGPTAQDGEVRDTGLATSMKRGGAFDLALAELADGHLVGSLRAVEAARAAGPHRVVAHARDPASMKPASALGGAGAAGAGGELVLRRGRARRTVGDALTAITDVRPGARRGARLACVTGLRFHHGSEAARGQARGEHPELVRVSHSCSVRRVLLLEPSPAALP